MYSRYVFNLGKHTKYTNAVPRSQSHAELFLEQGSGGCSRHITGTLWHFTPPAFSPCQHSAVKGKRHQLEIRDMRCCPVEKVTAANEQLVHPAAMTALG